MPKLLNQPLRKVSDAHVSPAAYKDESIDVDVFSLAGTLVCRCCVGRCVSVRQVRFAVAQQMGVPPSEVDLVFGESLLSVSTACPFRDAEFTAPVVLTVVRKAGATVALSLESTRGSYLTEAGLLSLSGLHGEVNGAWLDEAGTKAHITYNTEEEAKSMMRALSGTALRGAKGALHVTWASRPTLEVRIDGLELFSYRFTENDLKQLFSRFGEVEWVLVEVDGNRAQVTCSTANQAEQAARSLDGRWLEPLQGTLRVTCAGGPVSHDWGTKKSERSVKPEGECAARMRTRRRHLLTRQQVLPQ